MSIPGFHFSFEYFNKEIFKGLLFKSPQLKHRFKYMDPDYQIIIEINLFFYSWC